MARSTWRAEECKREPAVRFISPRVVVPHVVGLAQWRAMRLGMREGYLPEVRVVG